MKESVAEFVARGGSVKVVPPAERHEHEHVLPVKAKTIDIIDLGEGALIYSESALEKKTRRGVKPKPRKTRAAKINASLIPASLLGLLKAMGVPDEEEKETAPERG